VFRSEVHRFGDFACTVDDEQRIETIHLNGVTVAEDGVVGPNLLLLREAVLQSSSVLEDLARKQREEAVARAMADYESRRKAAHELEDSRLQEVDALIAAAIQSVRAGSPNRDVFEKLGIDSDDARFQKLEPLDLVALVEAETMKEDTWASITQSYFDSAKDLALRVNEDPAGAALQFKALGFELVQKTQDGAESTYEAVVERTGEAYELIAGVDVCETIEVINNEAVSYIGGAASGFTAAAMTARPSRSLMMIQRTYDELTIIRGVGIIQRSVTSGFIATQVVPALPSSATGIAATSAVVYLGAAGTCYVTSPEAKEHLQAASSLTFSALNVAKEKAEAIIRYVME